PDAARGHEGADGRGLIGAVDAVHRLPEIESARAERVGLAASHEARQIRLAYDHLLRRIPIRQPRSAAPCRCRAQWQVRRLYGKATVRATTKFRGLLQLYFWLRRWRVSGWFR